MAEPLTLEEYLKRQAAEYGQYVAARDIYYDGSLAYIEGSPVPASNVELHGYAEDGAVKKVASKSAAEKAAATVSIEKG